MLIYVDIDETICKYLGDRDYPLAVPIIENIAKINELYDNGHTIVYWTARGAVSKKDYSKLTMSQLNEWNAKHHELIMHTKPHYDLLICDKTMRIEEILPSNFS